jgi:23S rRNA (uracil1939-C5)-methyltransferase
MVRGADEAVLEGLARDLTHGGDAAVQTARGIVLARGALPGERVRVRLAGRSAGAQRGVLLAILEASPDRIEAPCALVERCGGCPLMTLASEAQLRFKRERLRQVLAHHGADFEPELVPSPRALGYRSRARLRWHRDRRGLQVGYHAAASRTLLDVETCVVLGSALARGYALLRERLAQVLIGRGEITLGVGAGDGCVVELVSEEPQPPAVYAALETLTARGELGGIALRIGDGAAACFGDPRQVSQGIDGAPLWAPVGAFTQANTEVNALLAAYVQAMAEPAGARVLELYAGHGNLTVGLARGASELRAVESVPAAAEACKQNLSARGLTHVRVVCDDAARGARGKGPVDAVVLDPPRAGAREVLATIVARKPQRIVYVSCDLGTLRRDLGELVRAGYRPDAAAAFDMFPQTAHLESVVRLRR